MPERIDFWGLPAWAPGIVYTVCMASALYFLVRFLWDASLWWRVGRFDRRTAQFGFHWDRPLLRLWRVVKYYLAQSAVLKQTYAGIMHAAIFWSFIIFFIGTALATLHSHFFGFLYGYVYLTYKLVLDLAVIVFLIGAAMAAYRRYVEKPTRLTLNSRFSLSLGLITLIVVLGALVESFRLAVVKPPFAAWSPVGWALAQLWIGLGASESLLKNIHLSLYTIHLLAVAAFFILLPTSTLLHIVTSFLNIFSSKIDQPFGKLTTPVVNAAGEPVYTDRLQRLSWKQLLEADTCTECGRCQDACPAYLAGRPLSPKKVILSLRDAFHKDALGVIRGRPETKSLLGSEGWITDEVLWSCTSCGACVKNCPVLIEHLDTIVDLRRFLVSESRVDDLLQDTLAKIGRYGNSFGQSERSRSKWAQSLPIKIKDARREPVEYLWFVGDYASFNPTVVETTRRIAQIFQNAGVDFGILHEAERNSGNDVRRVGEEGLYEMLVEKNSAAFAKASFKSVVTSDPHTYHALRREYPSEALAGRPVQHYAELLDQLISSGKLKLSKKLGYSVTYHDPCYLGRYNQVYDAPRRVIEACGCQVVEMPRCRENALCCNAGGGQIWIKEGEMKERPSENRIREAAALAGVGVFVVACPKDLTMYLDAVKTTSLEAKLAVKDLIDLVFEAL